MEGCSVVSRLPGPLPSLYPPSPLTSPPTPSPSVFDPQMQGVQQSKDMTLASNRNLAELNLALQPQLEERKEKLSSHYSSLQESFETYQFRKSTLGRPALDSSGAASVGNP